jgi:hypothetical protein
MKLERIGRLRVEFYDSVNELPSERYHKFNTYCLLYMGIGADAEDMQKHYSDMLQALHRKDLDRLGKMLQNYMYCLHLITEHIDLPSMAVACLVKSINDKEVNDVSEENLKRVAKRITQAKKRQMVVNLFKVLKKKLRMRSRSIFRRGSKVPV